MANSSILIVKTSSLGDVVHNMPAVTDLRRALPEARIDWLVEESYAPLVALHPAVDDVIPVSVRRWRKQPHRPETWREASNFVRSLRARSYDRVIDTQGLARSALLAVLARGHRHGYDAGSIRERLAVPFYQSRHAVSRRLHAIDRNRHLVARAVGYEAAEDADYGLVRETVPEGRPYAVLLHGTANAEKEWLEVHWVAVGRALQGATYEIVLPWGDNRERERSERLARALGSGARVPAREPLDQVACLLAGSALVVGLDTGLMHLAAALTVPTVAIFIASDPELTGPRGSGPLAVIDGRNGSTGPAAVLAAIDRLVQASPRSISPSTPETNPDRLPPG